MFFFHSLQAIHLRFGDCWGTPFCGSLHVYLYQNISCVASRNLSERPKRFDQNATNNRCLWCPGLVLRKCCPRMFGSFWAARWAPLRVASQWSSYRKSQHARSKPIIFSCMHLYIYIYTYVYIYIYSGWWFGTFSIFHISGTSSQLTNIFQMGWNHQPVYIHIWIYMYICIYIYIYINVHIYIQLYMYIVPCVMTSRSNRLEKPKHSHTYNIYI